MPLTDADAVSSLTRNGRSVNQRPPALHRCEVRQVADILREARGCRFCGLDQTVWIFLLAHGGGLALLLCTDTDLSLRVSGALSGKGSAIVSDVAVTVTCLSAIAAQCLLFFRLYRSDPGWVRIGCLPEGPAGQQCGYCSAVPPERSRHDFNTGQCVAKFDHFCPIIATAVGDCNHCMFWLYCVLQSFLILWGLALALDALLPCLLGDSVSKAVCWGPRAWQSWLHVLAVLLLVPCLNVFGGLAIAHAYLAATAQTTYEVVKGAKVPYLQEHYRAYAGPRGFPCSAKGVRSLLWHLMRGPLPPAPYSRGIAENLNVFFYAAKPHSYWQQNNGMSDKL
ncbi:hypothetical protein CVIRNUC_011213 [Coccomyxa viridis]|uniref:S-acyltransferase n=1 Tax=Coccomyxa viridis TaxID=1274662 RepID=A0AAV1IME4_9CHLO|nr:hypothetical protein CVIRNUC_011213 [Coccomyxa viridis]